MSSHKFDEDYFERGLEKRLSLYQNYRFMPWRVFPLASKLKEMYGTVSILDYGCAKGYLVRALRLMDMNAYGYDISRYAIENCLQSVRAYVHNFKEELPNTINVIFGKDVLEHIPKIKLESEMRWIRERCDQACFIVPMGENMRYRIAEYGFDVTHVIMEDEEWWSLLFINTGFEIVSFSHKLDGVKDHWLSHHPYGNGVFRLK